MKRSLVCLVLASLMVFVLVGCSSATSTPEAQSGPPPATSSTPASQSPTSASGSGVPSESVTSATGAAPRSTDQAAGVATLAKLAKIKIGMKYAAVVKIMGGPGKKLGEATVLGKHGVTYAWYGTEIATGIVVQLIDGTVSTKTQTGLK
jgi:hypothetical protein